MEKPVIFTLCAVLLLTLGTSSIGSKDVMCSNAQNTISTKTKQIKYLNNDVVLTNEILNENMSIIKEEEIVGVNTFFIKSKKVDKPKSSIKKEDKEKKKEKEDAEETIYDVYSNDEIEILQRIVEAEATGQDIECKINVANVIFNRVESDSFPNTIEEVVFQKSQFSPISDGRYYSVKITKDTIKACKKAFLEKDTTNGALYFDVCKNSWASRNKTFIMKDSSGHSFYK